MIFSGICHVVAVISLATLLWITPDAVAYWLYRIALLASFLYGSYLLGNFLDLLPRFRVRSKKKAVVITGCDTGFGHLLAHRLDSIGYKVFAGCFCPASEDAQRLKDSSSGRLRILPLDVTKDESVDKALQIVSKELEDNELWALVNNAGIIVRGELEWTPLEDYKKQFEVNTFGVVRTTQAFLPLLRKHKGRVVCTTSYGGRYTLPGLSSYCMSKYATNSFCDGLRLEMAKFSVKVVTVEPFSYKSSMTDTSTVLQSADDTWSKAPEGLKRSYGQGYVDAFKKSLVKFNEFSTNPNIHDVVDQLVEAVTCTNPHYRYVIGDFKSQMGFWFIQRLPLWIGHYIVKKYVTFDDETHRFCEEKQNQEKRRYSTNGHH